MKLFITCIALMISVSSFSQLIGWNFDQVVKLKGNDYELKKHKTNEGKEFNSITYKKKLYIDVPEFMADYEETFVFRNSPDKVDWYHFVGTKKESEVASIIESNNQKFKSIDKGKEQRGFEWYDEKSKMIYSLTLIGDVINDYRIIVYDVMPQE